MPDSEQQFVDWIEIKIHNSNKLPGGRRSGKPQCHSYSRNEKYSTD